MDQVQQQWHAELGQFPARCLVGLPEPTRFVVEVDGVDALLSLLSWELAEPRGAEAIGQPGGPVLDAVEFCALVDGVESNRFLADDLARLCWDKIEDAGLRLDRAAALAGANPDPTTEPLAFGALLRRLGARLVSVLPRDFPLVVPVDREPTDAGSLAA